MKNNEIIFIFVILITTSHYCFNIFIYIKGKKMKEQEHLMRKSMMYHFEEKSFTN